MSRGDSIRQTASTVLRASEVMSATFVGIVVTPSGRPRSRSRHRTGPAWPVAPTARGVVRRPAHEGQPLPWRGRAARPSSHGPELDRPLRGNRGRGVRGVQVHRAGDLFLAASAAPGRNRVRASSIPSHASSASIGPVAATPWRPRVPAVHGRSPAPSAAARPATFSELRSQFHACGAGSVSARTMSNSASASAVAAGASPAGDGCVRRSLLGAAHLPGHVAVDPPTCSSRSVADQPGAGRQRRSGSRPAACSRASPVPAQSERDSAHERSATEDSAPSGRPRTRTVET